MVNTFKTILALAALGASAYAVFLTINQRSFPVSADKAGPNDPQATAEVEVETGTPVSGDSLPFLGEKKEGPGPRVSSPTDVLAGQEGSLPPATVPSNPEPVLGSSNPPSQATENPPATVPSMQERSLPDLAGNRPSTQDPVAPMSFAEAMQQAEGLLTQRQLAKALRLLSKFYDWETRSRLSDAEYRTLTDLLDQLAGTVIYSPEPWLEGSRYQVQTGETLQQIAQRYEVPWQLLAKINGIANPENLSPGTSLKVISGPFDAVVDLEQFRLTLRLQGSYAGRFPLGVGQDYSPPSGEFRIAEKVFDPLYRAPGGMVIAADDPTNPYGEVWLDLGNGYGLHGTPNLNMLGRVGGPGCLRFSPRDIADLADILSVGSTITIIRGTQETLPVAERRNGNGPNRSFGPR